MTSNSSKLILATALLAVSGSAFASKTSKAISQCRDAVTQEQGEAAVAKLKKVKSRGASYDIWMNVKAGENNLRSYCSLKRGQLQRVVTEEGRWTSNHPKRPSDESDSSRTAMVTGK